MIGKYEARTVFENHRKSLVEHFELKMLKMVNLASFWKTEAFGQTVLPDMSVFIGQKLFKNAKIQIRHFESFSNI